MDIYEYLAIRTMEESAEVAQAVSKSVTFGPESYSPFDPEKVTNRDKIVAELNDLIGLGHMLAKAGMIPVDWISPDRIAAREKKTIGLMPYSIASGCLSLQPGDPYYDEVANHITHEHAIERSD